MIHVCSLARLHATVETTGAGHVVTLLKDTDRVERPRTILAANHLILGMDDISAPLDGYVMPGDEHVRRLIAFVLGWDRRKPMVVHCYAGISRSTAGAYVAACALNPRRDEAAIAYELRRVSPTATPRALARRQTTATVGLAWLRSIWDNIDFDTPAWRESSSSESARAWRRAASVAPTRGGSLAVVFIALNFSFDILHAFQKSNGILPHRPPCQTIPSSTTCAPSCRPSRPPA